MLSGSSTTKCFVSFFFFFLRKMFSGLIFAGGSSMFRVCKTNIGLTRVQWVCDMEHDVCEYVHVRDDDHA